MSDKPEQYMLVLHTTGPATPIFSTPQTYEECMEGVARIHNAMYNLPSSLEGQKCGFTDLLIFPQHIVRVGITPYYD